MEYDLKILASWINVFAEGDEQLDSAISHWLHGLDSEETNKVISFLSIKGRDNYTKYFKNT